MKYCVFCGEKTEYINNVFTLERAQPINACGCAKCNRGFFLSQPGGASSLTRFCEMTLRAWLAVRGKQGHSGRRRFARRIPVFCPTCGGRFQRQKNRVIRRKAYRGCAPARWYCGCAQCNRSYLLYATYPLDLRESATRWDALKKILLTE